jgi:4-amino-4-deoxy-L-arabinose transferase-like glycosyltransferase
MDNTPKNCGTRSFPPLIDAGILLAIVAVFLALTFYQIDLPGLYNDEAMDVVPAMQLLQGQPADLSRGAGLTIGDRTYPLMTSDYQGVVSTYLIIPFLSILGVGGFAIRAMSISFGLAGVILTYFVGRKFFNRPAGLIAAFMLAVMPSYVFWSRIGLYVVNEVVPIGLGALLLFMAWRERRHWGYLLGGMFMLGLGLSTKLLFLWFLSSLVGALLASNWRSVMGYFRGSRAPGIVEGRITAGRGVWNTIITDVGVSVAGFTAGAFPLILYNFQTRGTYLVLRTNLVNTPHGVNNSDFLSNVLTEADALRVLLDGSYFWFQGAVLQNWFAPLGLGALAVLMAGLVGFRLVPTHFAKGAAFVALFIFLVFIQSCFTVSGLWATHLLIVLPFPQLLAGGALGGALAWLWQSRRNSRLAVAVMGSLLVIAVSVYDLKTDIEYHQALARTGGYSTFSDSIYGLAQYLDENHITSPLAGDWGIKSSIQILTQGRVNPREVYGLSAEPDKAYRTRVKELMRDPNNVWIFHVKESTAYKLRLSVLEEITKRNGLNAEMTKVFFQRDGKGLFRLFQVVPVKQ